jgi:hypothetical protein
MPIAEQQVKSKNEAAEAVLRFAFCVLLCVARVSGVVCYVLYLGFAPITSNWHIRHTAAR